MREEGREKTMRDYSRKGRGRKESEDEFFLSVVMASRKYIENKISK